ncbi:hypothetical protein, conserved [Plasmodium gonderi]|uniref:Uncharacterized protein n=1 Tax=Plasmodium gonderi TaxID=77519 RepID=A0A1Y1JLL0_PLAGO|nr:hypothetical protein, conserved [Plasmodium gonderi]GAW83359.1 hypothetical protein, conserved [Plasmodium gonderi]
MYLLNKRFEVNHVGRIRNISLLGIHYGRGVKIRLKNFTHSKSIYEWSTFHESVKQSDKAQGVSSNLTSPPKFLHDEIHTSSKCNEKLRGIYFSNNMDDMKIFFDNNLNEIKNHEYVYLLFKIYEIIFHNFYKTHEFCDILKLDNPHFRYITLEQYIDEWAQNHSQRNYRMGISNLEENEILFFENDDGNDIYDELFERSRHNPISGINHFLSNDMCMKESTTNNNYKNAEEATPGGNVSQCVYIKETNKEEKMKENMCVQDETEDIDYSQNSQLDGTVKYHASRYYVRHTMLSTLMELHLNYILYIEQLNVKENTWKSYASSFMKKKYEEFYRDILNIINKKIFFFSCKDIINYLYIIKRINLSSVKEISILGENIILQNIKYLDENYLVRIGYIYLNNSNKKKHIRHINRYNSKNFLETYINFVQSKIKSMNNENFVKMLEYISNNNYKHIQFFREIKSEVYKRYNNFTEVQIMKLFFLYSQNINAADNALMHNFVKAIVNMFSHTNSQTEHTSMTLAPRGKYELHDDKNNDDGNTGDRKNDRDQVVIPLSVLLNGIWTSAKYFKDYPFLLIKSEKNILKNINNFSASTVSMLIWAYSTVENKNTKLCFSNDLYFQLKDRAMELYQNMTPKQLSNSLLGLATTVGRTVSNENRVNTEFHEAVEKFLLQGGGIVSNSNVDVSVTERTIKREKYKINSSNETFLNMFSSEDLANMCYAYSIVRSGSKEFHTLIQSAILNKMNDLSPQHIARIAYTYGSMYFYASYTLLSALQYEILQRIHQFSHYEISDILWCYCVNKFFDGNFWKCMLRAIDFEKVGDSRCCLLYSCLTYVNLIDSSILDSSNTLRVFHLLSEHYWQFQSLEYLANFADEVVNIICKENDLIGVKKKKKKKRETMEEARTDERSEIFKYVKKSYDYEGFLIDIYFEYKNINYAVFLYSALNTTSDGYPLGESVLKSRYLKRKNFKTVHLLHSIWNECRSNRIDLLYAQL